MEVASGLYPVTSRRQVASGPFVVVPSAACVNSQKEIAMGLFRVTSSSEVAMRQFSVVRRYHCLRSLSDYRLLSDCRSVSLANANFSYHLTFTTIQQRFPNT